MTVQKLIDLLLQEVAQEDRENAEIEIWLGENEYDIESMGGFSISSDITIMLKPVENSNTIRAMHFKKSKEHLKEKVEKKLLEERQRNKRQS